MCEIGRCHYRLGRTDEAIKNLRDCLAQAKLDAKKRREFRALLTELESGQPTAQAALGPPPPGAPPRGAQGQTPRRPPPGGASPAAPGCPRPAAGGAAAGAAPGPRPGRTAMRRARAVILRPGPPPGQRRAATGLGLSAAGPCRGRGRCRRKGNAAAGATPARSAGLLRVPQHLRPTWRLRQRRGRQPDGRLRARRRGSWPA